MNGLVYEWIQDCFGDYPNTPVVDPTGAQSSDLRTIRGGSWYHSADYLRLTDHSGMFPTTGFYEIGFRLIRTK
jgi:formylglycine-generating enzyme required for sulfatase activity